jgi:PTS system fructose-specific IIA component/PTS system nitrogen regulatory IIA component
MVYPSEADTLSRTATLPAELPSGLHSERIVRDLPALPFETALQRIVEHGFPAPPARVAQVVKLLVEGERTFSSEVRPGVVVPHARVEGLREPMVLLGTSPEGIQFPRARAAAKLVFVLLSPAERPEEHLRALAEIARMVSSEENVSELLEGHPLEEEEEA